MAKQYRAIVLFSAADGKAAKKAAEAAAKSCSGKVDRLTERRETWGEVSDADDETSES